MAIELAPGTVIGTHYRLEHLLGEGGMGAVWAAEDTAAGRRCAIKLIKDAAGDPGVHKRFLREGRASAAVRHPNVVDIFEVLDPEGELPAIVMELLEGESLRALLRRQHKLSLAELADIMVPVVSAVGTAHALGIVHRDLKPENIFLACGASGEQVVKVLDFGIAKLTMLDGEATRSTGNTTSQVLGTPMYMAPEQVLAEKDLDHRADVWALGITFYECLAGACPTEGDQILKNVLSKPFEPLSQIVPDLPDAISQLVARMLARKRSERSADLHEVLEVLEPFARTQGIQFGSPASPSTRTNDPMGTVPLVSQDDERADEVARRERMSRENAPRLRRGRDIVMLGIATVIALLGLTGAWWRCMAPRFPPSPFGDPDVKTKIACPILRVADVAKDGWLGAAAAAVACERVRMILGGHSERTLAPAELLDLPRGPEDAFPADPYGQLDAREDSLTAARQQAQAYLDGAVTWTSGSFVVELSLHRADGTEMSRATGRGRGLYEAVRSAMTPLIGPGLIPKASELEPEIAVWSRTKNVDDALGILDLSFAIAHNAGGLRDECRGLEDLSARVPDLGPEGRWLCAYTLGQPAPKVELADSDPSDEGRATRIRINYSIHQIVNPEDAKFLRGLFERERTPRGRSLLAAIESCLLGDTDSQEARAKAILAVRSEPRNPEGVWCMPWEQLMTLEREISGTDSTLRAMQAWVPWNSYGWLEPGFRSKGKDPATLPLLWRAYRLSPFDVQIADTLAISLLVSGDRTAARGIAAELRAGGYPMHDVASDMIDTRVVTSEARFGRALALARKTYELSPGDSGWIRAQRFDAAWHALELGILLGRERKVADDLVKRFLDPDPSPLDRNLVSIPMRVPAICALSSAPDRCFTRFRALQPQFPSPVTQETKDFATGAERYAQRDFAGAARVWRPLLSGRMMMASTLPDAMVDAFQRTGAADLAERVDEEVRKRAHEFNGATLGHVRGARRALERGDRAKARELAKQVIKAWSFADEEPPAVASMRRLIEVLERFDPPVPPR